MGEGRQPGPAGAEEALGAAAVYTTAKRNESIIIRDDIVVTVIDIRGDKVRLGVEAPKEVPVHRREVYEAIKESKRDSNQ